MVYCFGSHLSYNAGEFSKKFWSFAMHGEDGRFVVVPILDRFWSKVSPEPNSGCFLWDGAQRKGYGYFWNGRGAQQAHRFAWILENGPIPGDFVIDHLCRTKCCVNPAHMELVTLAESNRRRGPYRKHGWVYGVR